MWDSHSAIFCILDQVYLKTNEAVFVVFNNFSSSGVLGCPHTHTAKTLPENAVSEAILGAFSCVNLISRNHVELVLY